MRSVSSRWRLALVLVVMLSSLTAARAWACYAIIVGRKASADGAVLLAHNEQNGGRRILNFRRVPRLKHPAGAVVKLHRGGSLPQVPETWSFFWSEDPGLAFSDGYLNEWGVAIVSDGCRTREDDYDTLVRRNEIRDGGIGYMLRRLVAERAKTAREGVELAGRLVERFGYVDSGRSYSIADPREAWLFSVVRGRRWVAQRVPDDAIVVLPNIHIIGRVNLNDPANFLGSADLIDYAVKRGWFDPTVGKPFNFRKAYRKNRDDPADPRRWQGRRQVAGSTESWPPDCPPPFSIRPKEKVTVAQLMQVLRFTGTPGPLSSPTTQEGAVFQLRADLPPTIGCVYWRTTAEPATSVFTPWYLGVTKTPECYYRPIDVRTQLTLDHHFQPPAGTFDLDPRSAWWKFRTPQDRVRPECLKPDSKIRAVWTAFEKATLAAQPHLEDQALRLWQTDPPAARALLTDYCFDQAQKACRLADRLAAEGGAKGNRQADR